MPLVGSFAAFGKEQPELSGSLILLIPSLRKASAASERPTAAEHKSMADMFRPPEHVRSRDPGEKVLGTQEALPIFRFFLKPKALLCGHPAT